MQSSNDSQYIYNEWGKDKIEAMKQKYDDSGARSKGKIKENNREQKTKQ